LLIESLVPVCNAYSTLLNFFGSSFWLIYRPDGVSSKTFASGARGQGVQIPNRSNLPHVTNGSPPLQPCVWSLAQSREDGHRSLVKPERVFNEYNNDLIFLLE